MSNFIFYLKQSFHIIYNNRFHIIPSLFIIIIFLNFSLNIINISSFKKNNSNNDSIQRENQSNNLRFLSQVENSNSEILSFNLLEAINSNITELALYYEFVENITSHSYYGKWENLKLDENNKNIFVDNYGDIELIFQKKRTGNYFLNLNQKNNSNITVQFMIKDGGYIDNFIQGNFSFNFKNIPLISNLDKDHFSIMLENITMTYAYGHYMDLGKKKNLNNTYINMTFYKKPENFINKITHTISSTAYSMIEFNIYTKPDLSNNNDKNKNDLKIFEISFTNKAYGVQKYPIKILNYSIILTFLAFIEIYFSTKFLLIVNENIQMALNIDLITIFVQIMWTSLICGVNFFLSLTYEPLTYEYGMPSMTYFILFSIFLLRILFIGWKSRYIELLFNDAAQFRKKLFRFYLVFYFLLLCTLISIKLWYTYFIFTFFYSEEHGFFKYITVQKMVQNHQCLYYILSPHLFLKC